MRLSLGRRERSRGKGVIFFFFNLFLIIQLYFYFNFPLDESVLPMMVIGKRSPSVFILTHEVSHPVFFACPIEERE